MNQEQPSQAKAVMARRDGSLDVAIQLNNPRAVRGSLETILTRALRGARDCFDWMATPSARARHDGFGLRGLSRIFSTKLLMGDMISIWRFL